MRKKAVATVTQKGKKEMLTGIFIVILIFLLGFCYGVFYTRQQITELLKEMKQYNEECARLIEELKALGK